MMNIPDEISLSCDVLVIGSGVSGYCAAIQAGRAGCDTLLIEKDEVLGGNSGPNLGVGITGADRYMSYATETGVIHELQEEAAWIDALGMRTGAYTISRRFEALIQSALEAAGVRVMKRCLARDPVMENTRITAVIAEDMAAFRTLRIAVRHVVIECSGDGELAARAGADFDMGSEAQPEFGERSAPATRTRLVQGSSLVGIAWNAGRAVSFTPPPGTPRFLPRIWEGKLEGCLHHGHDGYVQGFRENRPGAMTFLYMTEKGGAQDTIRDDATIYEELLRSFWAEWDHIKNGPHAEDARQWDLLWLSPKAGKRESRRLLGDYILTQTDLEAGRCYDDDIAYGGHNLDEHRALPSGHAEIHGHSIPPLYGIPLRACYSRNIDNLLMGGRLISATHLAHSAIRVMRTGGAVGQAVGLVAALCRQYGCTPREVGQTHFAALRDALHRTDASLLHVPLPAAGDLARSATVTASSERRFNDVEAGEAQVPLLNRLGNLLYDWPARLDAVELWLANLSDQDEPLRLQVARSTRERRWRPTDNWCKTERTRFTPAQFRPLAEVTAVIPAHFEGWFRIALPQALALDAKDAASDDDVLLLSLDVNPIVLWAVAEQASELLEWWEYRDEAAEWNRLPAAGAMRLFPAPTLGEAESAVNGWSRRYSTAPTHQWQTPPGAALPQELLLSWEQPHTFSRVVLHFDNLPRMLVENPWEHGPRALPTLVRAYALDVCEQGAWREVAHITENCHRFREHSFAPVTASALRLRVLATHGAAQARVYEIGVFER